MESKKYNIKIDISKDKLIAYLNIQEDENGIILNKENLLNALNNKKIIYGIIQKNIEYACANPENVKDLIVAQGVKPINGEDGKIIFQVEFKSSAAPKILEDGTVDYKNLELFKNIKKGDVIAKKINPTEGKTGINIFGQKIEPIKGKDIRIPAGKNTVIKGDLLVADSDGHIIYNGSKIEINKILEVKEVDTSVGNIITFASVKVTGNVKSGFIIESQGDVEIFGVVEASTIKAKGNIIIHKGVQGNGRALLIAEGDITAKYFQNCNISAKGSVFSEAILYSNVKTSESVKLIGSKGQILGSKIMAAKEIIAVNVGSDMGTVTELQVGILPETRMKISELNIQIKQSRDNIEKVEKVLNYLGKFEYLPPDKREIYEKTKISLEQLKILHENLNEQLAYLNAQAKDSSNSIIKILGVVYQGTKIVIDDIIMNVDRPIKYSMFVRDESDIKLLPLT